MPVARIDVPAGKAADYRSAIRDTVYQAMIRVLKVPADDRFQVISEHSVADLVIDPHYLDIERSADAIVIQVTLNEGRTLADVSRRTFAGAHSAGAHRAAHIALEHIVRRTSCGAHRSGAGALAHMV
jgi:hypothetical protein